MLALTLPWLMAFAFTQAVETPIYLRATHGRLGVSFFASTFTHPIVWFVFPMLIPDHYLAMVAAAELFAWWGEAFWLRANGVERALLWSLGANTSSLCLGLLSRAAFDVP